MQLRTPKRYRSGNKRSIISLRWLWLWVLTPVVVGLGIQVYQHVDVFGPPIHQAMYNIVASFQNGMATAAAPTPLPTQDPADRLARADDDWKQGRIESALDSYTQVLGAVPNDVEAHYRVTLGLLMEGKLRDALDAAEKTVTANPFSSDAWAIRAMVMDWNERYGESISSALYALELDSKNARAMAFLAEAYLDHGDTDLAKSTIDKALETNPDSFEALRVRGLIAQKADFDAAAAKDYYQQAHDAAPNLPYLAIDLADIYFYADNDFDQAISTAGDVVEKNPGNSLALFRLGVYYYSGVGNLTQALDYLSRCVEANPKSIGCNALLGRVQSRLDNNTAAVESLQKAIDLGTTNPRHYLWMGMADIAMGQCQTAIPVLQKGYDLAQGGVDDEALGVIQDKLRECQAPVPGAEATAEATSPG
jgi:tetratricopeptide (TPR) repeat protein